ncbi:hypothetical protein [Paludisphaera rhizosphaerae]|uniref:hypothetical protein n=1 Tax=Paludisphaera rhizosphaerae TaxID=2711216 RepID=UPI0013EA3639|nr:hypothetical protein [Paludisphaera rhizosphaerae]
MVLRRTVLLAPVVLSLAPLFGVLGCGKAEEAPKSEPTAAKQHLITALDAWKGGKSKDELTKGTPPMLVVDGDWDKKSKLTEYVVEGDGEPVGAGVRWKVPITITTKAGKTVKKDAIYVVNIAGTIVVTREDTNF